MTSFRPVVLNGGSLANLPAAAQLNLGAFALPAVDGSPNQVLQTNGSGVVSWQTVSGGGGGPSYLTMASNQTTNTSGFELIGSFTLDASAYSTIKFVSTAAVTSGTLTGDVVLYNLTDASTVVTHTYTSTTPTQIVSLPLSLPSGSKTYEVRQRVTGGFLVSDRVVTEWAGLYLA